MRSIAAASLFLLASIGLAAAQPMVAGPCLDVKQPQPVRLEGVLTRKVFPGPPNYRDIRKGDMPEPAYILRLSRPVCVAGDMFADRMQRIDRVQIFPADADTGNQPLWADLRRLVGRPVIVEGREPFGAHTGHHHAPLLLPVTRISRARAR
jgi:hypothetical protein